MMRLTHKEIDVLIGLLGDVDWGVRVLTGVGGSFQASHRDVNGLHHNGAVHSHVWHVKVWHACEDNNDAIILQNHLRGVLKHGFEGQELPPDLSRGEDMAAAILRLSPPSCIAVEISRDAEQLYARVER